MSNPNETNDTPLLSDNNFNATDQQQSDSVQETKIVDYLFNTANWLISSGCCVFTAYGSVAELIGEKIFHFPGENYPEMIKANPVKTLLATGIPGVFALLGIVSLNVSGINGVRKELTEGRFLDFFARLLLSIPSGIAMSVLASEINLPFLIGKKNVNNVIHEIVKYGALEVVGLGIGGVLLSTFKNAYERFSPAWLYGKDKRCFNEIIDILSDAFRLQGNTDNMSAFTNVFQNNENKLEGLMNYFSSNSISNILDKDQGAANHWLNNTIINTFSVVASVVGTWSLKGLIEFGTKDTPVWMQQLLSWGGLGANLILWSISLSDFIKSILNPHSYFADTWTESDFQSKLLRIASTIFNICFGTMMALIPLVSDDVASKLITYTEVFAGFLINALIGNLSTSLVWKYDYGLIQSSESDKTAGTLQALKGEFAELSQVEQVSCLSNLNEKTGNFYKKGTYGYKASETLNSFFASNNNDQVESSLLNNHHQKPSYTWQ